MKHPKRSRLSAGILSPVLIFLIASCARAFPVGDKEAQQTELMLWLLHAPRVSYYSKILFAVGAGDATFRSFRIDQTTGALTAVSSMTPPGAGIGTDVHPAEPYVYTTINAGNGIAAFRFDRDTGVLTAAGSVSPGNANTHRVRVLLDGSALYFNTIQAGNSYQYRVPVASGALSAATLVNATLPSNSQFMNVDPTGRFLYSNSGAGIQVFQTNNGGALVSSGNVPINGAEGGIRSAFHSDGSAMYLATSANRVFSFTINQTTGLLSAVSGLAPGSVQHVLIHPNDQYLYALRPGAGVVSLYRIGTDRSLSLVSDMAAAGVSFDTGCLDRGGRFLFLTKAANPGIILSYRILADGTISSSSSITIGNTLTECVTSIETASVWP